MTGIEGTVRPGFEKVRDAFAANFADHDELGAAFACHVGGELVVDLWSGVADRRTGAPWTADTLQLIFSTSKGLAAICVGMLVDRGLLDLEQPVSDHWPEFGQAGKEAVTVGEMMSHQVGIPVVDAQLTLEEILAVEPVVGALAAQTPVWEPGTAHGYHALTYGWLVGELVRRIDGRGVGTFLAEEVAGPLGAQTWIGLPESEQARVSRLEPAPPPEDPELLAIMRELLGPGTLANRALSMDGAFGMPGVGDEMAWNRPDVHRSEIPAANAITTARSLSAIYGATVAEVDGVRLLSDEVVDAMRAERVDGPDRVLAVRSRFGAGFMLHGELAPMMGDGSFGHPGAGGSLGYADPETGVGYGYVMNQMGSGLAGDPRTIRLTEAVRACL